MKRMLLCAVAALSLASCTTAGSIDTTIKTNLPETCALLETAHSAFIAASAASLLILRPIARRHMKQPPHVRTGAAALIGCSATVLEQVDRDGGRVKIGGEVWSARSYDEDQVIEPGDRVEVLKIEGATALVAK